MTADLREPPISPTPAVARRAWLPWLLAGVVAVLAVVASALFVARDNGASSNQTVTSAGELASIQQACGQWRSAYTGSQAPPAAWCNAMVGWMTTQTDGGYMMGSMMWGDAGRMRDTCLRWMATAPAVSGATSNASAWCDAMAGWMTQNGGPWTHMMGR